MSAKIMGLVWDLEIGREEKLILLAYADHADHNGENIYPAIGTVARKTGYSERSVQRITRRLVEEGYLAPAGGQEGGAGITARWLIPLKDDKIAPLKRVTNGTKKGDICAKRVTNGTKKGDTAMAPEPSLTVQFKPSAEEETAAASQQVMPMLSRTIGFVAMPPSEIQRLEQLTSLIEHYGVNRVEAAIRSQYQRWVSTKRKNGGGRYRATNMGWVDWAQDELAGTGAGQKDWDEMTQDEKKQALLALGDDP